MQKYTGLLGQPSDTIPVYLQFTYTSNTHANTHKNTNEYTNTQEALGQLSYTIPVN